MRNCTLLLLCIGALIVFTYADEVENESVQELDTELAEDVLFWKCRKQGQDCTKRRCCRKLKCDNKTKKCVKEPCKTEGQACRKNNNCCKGMKCCKKQWKCIKKAELIPEDFLENIEIDEEFDDVED